MIFEIEAVAGVGAGDGVENIGSIGTGTGVTLGPSVGGGACFISLLDILRTRQLVSNQLNQTVNDVVWLH